MYLTYRRDSGSQRKAGDICFLTQESVAPIPPSGRLRGASLVGHLRQVSDHQDVELLLESFGMMLEAWASDFVNTLWR